MQSYTSDSSAFMYMNPSLYLRQGLNQCGPFSIMAVINILKDENINSKEINTNTKSRMDNGMTYPWGLIDVLSDYNIKSHFKLLLIF